MPPRVAARRRSRVSPEGFSCICGRNAPQLPVAPGPPQGYGRRPLRRALPTMSDPTEPVVPASPDHVVEAELGSAAAAVAPVDFDPVPALARELQLPPAGVRAVVDLLAEGNTVPFIARYRKERTGGLDEVQIRAIEERRAYLLDMAERRAAILASIREQGKLTPELEAKIQAADTKATLEDLYAPFKPRRRTRAMAAREKGLEPLAQRILAQPHDGNPAAEAAAFITTG